MCLAVATYTRTAAAIKQGTNHQPYDFLWGVVKGTRISTHASLNTRGNDKLVCRTSPTRQERDSPASLEFETAGV